MQFLKLYSLQISQQRSDDPRRGGKVGIEVRGAWNNDPNEETKLDEAMMEPTIALSLQN